MSWFDQGSARTPEGIGGPINGNGLRSRGDHGVIVGHQPEIHDLFVDVWFGELLAYFAIAFGNDKACAAKVKFHPLPNEIHEQTMIMDGFEDREANTMEKAFVRIRIPMKQVVTEEEDEGENSK